MKIKKPFPQKLASTQSDIDIAKNLIVNAKAGFDSVKFQKEQLIMFIQKTSLIKKGKVLGELPKRAKEGLEFNHDQYKEIEKFCLEQKIEWFASAWDLDSLKFLDNFNCKYKKLHQQ